MADRYYIVKEDNNDGCGGLLIAGAVLFIVALPVFLLWLLLFGESKKRYNWLKHSLSNYMMVHQCRLKICRL